jgi:hypothetical protein
MILECIWNDFASTRRIYNQTSKLQPLEILRVRLVSGNLHFHPTAQDVAWKLLERTRRVVVSKDGLKQSPRHRSVWWSLGLSGNAAGAAAQRNSRDFFHVPSFLPSSWTARIGQGYKIAKTLVSQVTIDFRHMFMLPQNTTSHRQPQIIKKRKRKNANTGTGLLAAFPSWLSRISIHDCVHH